MIYNTSSVLITTSSNHYYKTKLSKTGYTNHNFKFRVGKAAEKDNYMSGITTRETSYGNNRVKTGIVVITTSSKYYYRSKLSKTLYKT